MANKKSKRFFAIRDGLNGQDRLDVEAAVETVKSKRHRQVRRGCGRRCPASVSTRSTLIKWSVARSPPARYR